MSTSSREAAARGRLAASSLPPDAHRALAVQRDLLEEMLRVTREQRRCLISGDLRGLDRANRDLADLLERQESCRDQVMRLGQMPACAPAEIDDVRQLARRLRNETRANYLLASRGAQFARHSLSLIAGAASGGQSEADAEVLGLLDHPA